MITEEHFHRMKSGAILCNAGHFDVEVDTACLNRIAVEQKQMKPNIRGYRLSNGKWLYVLAEGRLVNLAAGDGHPAEIMDMSFAIQALSCSYLARNRGKLDPRLIPVPREIDLAVAFKKLETLGIGIDTLTPEQREYIGL
ncbi:MAG: adenosylhomocysteinase [Spirochaetales bacterium]|nr:adenosylhomocysteinase [Spirochaetales bacterium]